MAVPPVLPLSVIARLLAPATAGRTFCILASADWAAAFPGSTIAASLSAMAGAETFGIILSGDIAALKACAGRFAPGIHASGTILAYAGPAVLPSLEPELPCRADLLLTQLNATLVADAARPESRAARLVQPVPAADATTHVMLWSDQPLPDLALGLYTNQAAASDASASPARWAVHAAHRAPAVMLGTRLHAIEDRLVALRGENHRLNDAAIRISVAGAGAAFDPPRTEHPWPLAKREPAAQDAPDLYDRRPDDDILRETEAGDRFFARFDLHGLDPRFADAVDTLNATPATLTIAIDAPEISIVIPMYGQLGYTLNAIDSLLHHASRHSAEIIVVDDHSPDAAASRLIPLLHRIRSHRMPANSGFIAACNAGAAMARGRYIVLLNNDTRVADGWLNSLRDSFELFPRAGLVGSKMIYPTGRLQEAGNILWRDGSAWNYGRGDDPNRPQYCYARQTDYVSGCSIALSRALWTELGGFDPFYAPAYAEDADLCQRVIAAGHEVWFQPLSRVLHYEGKTSGNSTGEGVKAYQLVNLQKLHLRWRESFETHRRRHDNPFAERERAVRRRMLVVDSVTPTPDQDAGSLQTVLALRCVQASGYKAHFVPEDNWLFVPGYTAALQRAGVDCAYAPYEGGFESYIRRYGWLFDVVMVYRVAIMDRCMELIRAYAPQAVVIFHVADLHHLRMQREAALHDSDAGRDAAERMRDREFSLVGRADCTVTHSTAEAALLAGELPQAPVVVWPLMARLVGTTRGFEGRRDVCYLGGYRHPPNVDAVTVFVRDIMPLLRRMEPGLRFIIAGANPTSEVLALAAEDIIITGQVADLRDLFDPCRVFVCPLRVGAGVKGKIASALSHGIPIVSTNIGVEGAGLTNGVDVVVADAPADMASAIMRLYRDEALWTRLSLAGQDLVHRELSLEMGCRQLDQAVNTAWRHKLGLAHAG